MDDWDGPPPSLWRRAAWPLGLFAAGTVAAVLFLSDPSLNAPAVQAAPPLPTWTPLASSAAYAAPGAAPAAGAAQPGAFGVAFTGAQCPPGMTLHVVLRETAQAAKQAGELTVPAGEERRVELPVGTYRMEYWTQAGSRRSPVQRSDVAVQPATSGTTRLSFPGC